VVYSVYDDGSNNMITAYAYRQVGTGPSTSTVTITTSSNVGRRVGFATEFASGFDTTSPIRQAKNATPGSSSTMSGTFDSAVLSGSYVEAIAISDSYSSGITPGSGFTEEDDQVSSDINAEIENRTGSTSTGFSWSSLGTTSNYGVAIEVQAAAGGPATYSAEMSSGITVSAGDAKLGDSIRQAITGVAIDATDQRLLDLRRFVSNNVDVSSNLFRLLDMLHDLSIGVDVDATLAAILTAYNAGTTVTIGSNTIDDYSGTEDADIKSNAPTSNTGTSAYMNLINTTNNYKGVIRFTGLSSLPASAVVIDATLYVYKYSDLSAANGSLYQILQPWVEGEVTWNEYATGSPWDAGGCSTDDVDRAATALATFTLDTGVGYEAITGAGIISAIQDWLDGVSSNDGFLLEMDSGAGIKQLNTAQKTGATERPYLSVTFTSGVYSTDMVSTALTSAIMQSLIAKLAGLATNINTSTSADKLWEAVRGQQSYAAVHSELETVLARLLANSNMTSNAAVDAVFNTMRWLVRAVSDSINVDSILQTLRVLERSGSNAVSASALMEINRLLGGREFESYADVHATLSTTLQEFIIYSILIVSRIGGNDVVTNLRGNQIISTLEKADV